MFRNLYQTKFQYIAVTSFVLSISDMFMNLVLSCIKVVTVKDCTKNLNKAKWSYPNFYSIFHFCYIHHIATILFINSFSSPL